MNQSGSERAGRKIFAFFYGALTYIGVWAILIYIVAFVGNYTDWLRGSQWADVIPLKSIDSGTPESLWVALPVDLILLAILSLQHSVMPRVGFKRWITRFVPKHLERSTYVILAIAALSLLIWQWRPLPQIIWSVENPTLYVLIYLISFAGWLTVLLATFQVGHWEIFGVKQVIDYIQGTDYTRPEYGNPSPEFFKTGWPITRQGVWYNTRHPDFLGFCIAFWFTPVMTLGHLVFAVWLTLYIMIGIFLLERNLSDLYGEPYREYVRTRSKLIPWFVRKART